MITPPLEGTILAGVTRDSVIQLAKDWHLSVVERKISIDEVLLASSKSRLKEAFGVGTAAVVLSIGEIHYNNHSIIINSGKMGELAETLYTEITAIQYGEKADKFGWCYPI